MNENEIENQKDAAVQSIPLDTEALAQVAKFFQNQSSNRHPTKRRATKAQRQAYRRRQKLARRVNRGTGKGETRLSLRKR